MSLITQNKKSLFGGVSQQPDDTRLVHQVDEMINFYPTLELGLRLRNPSLPISTILPNGQPTTITFPEEYNNAYMYGFTKGKETTRDDKYIYVITKDGGLEIIDTNFVVNYNYEKERYEYTAIVYKEGFGLEYDNYNARKYIKDFTTENGYSMTSIKDSVFVTNKSYIAKMSSATNSNDYKKKGYIWIKRSDPVYGWQYGCTITTKNLNTGQTHDYVVPLSSAQTDGTDKIAAYLSERIGALADFNSTFSHSVLEIELIADGYELVNVEANDSYGNAASFGWAWSVRHITDLPKSISLYHPIVQVGDNDKNSIWFKYEDKKWKETTRPDIKYHILDDTMPHIIKKEYTSTGLNFVVKQYEWDDRLVGDDETNDKPIFIDRTINDIFFFKNRFGILTNDGLALSEHQ